MGIDALERFTKLSEKLKSPTEREEFSRKDIKCINEALQNITTHEDDLKLAYELLRCLRNSCVHSCKNQNLIVNANVLSTFGSFVEILMSPETSRAVKNKDLYQKLTSVSIQFLGNLVVQNKRSQDAVWKTAFPKLFFSMMSNLGVKEKDILCMVVYNCVRSRTEIYNTSDEYWFMISILEYCTEYEDAEWGLLIMEWIISSPSFMKFYKELQDYPALRCSLLELASVQLSTDNSTFSGIEEEFMLYLCDEFSTKSTCILRLASALSPELEEEAGLLLKVLRLLSITTSCFDKYQKVRHHQNLLNSAITVLKQKQIANEGKKNEKSKEQLPKEHPIVAFEKDLVRVISNMAYRNVNIQNQIRNAGGIEVLLNACNIDDSNPFIMQWAIFGIKNVCYENQANQQYIETLQQQGLASYEFLKDNKIDCRLENGKIKMTSLQ